VRENGRERECDHLCGFGPRVWELESRGVVGFVVSRVLRVQKKVCHQSVAGTGEREREKELEVGHYTSDGMQAAATPSMARAACTHLKVRGTICV